MKQFHQQHEDASAELRILSGIHAGATKVIRDGSYLIGSGLEADIILRDPHIVERHAILEVSDSGARIALDILGDDRGNQKSLSSRSSSRSMMIEIGRMFSLGKVHLCIDAVGIASIDDGDVCRTAMSAEDEQNAPMIQPRQQRSYLARWVAALALGIPTLIVTGSIWLGAQPGLAFGTNSEPLEKLTDIKQQADNLLRQLKFHEAQLETRALADGSVSITGYVSTSSDMQALKGALDEAAFRVSMLVYANEDLFQQVEQVLIRENSPLRPQSAVAGLVLLTSSAIATPEQIKQSEVAITREVKGIRRIQVAHSEALDALGFLQSELQRHGLSEMVSLHQEGDAVIATGSLTERARERWERVQQSYEPHYQTILRLEGRFEKNPSTARMPFEIVQVLGGSNPSVLTSDGMRIFVGGQHAGYQLVSVTNGRVVFGAAKPTGWAS